MTRRWLPRGWVLVTPVVLLVAGLLFVASARTARGTDLRASGGGDLVTLIQRQSERNAQQAQMVTQLQASVDSLTQSSARQDGKVAAAVNAAKPLAVAAGATPVTGTALAVTLADAPVSSRALPGVAADDLVVHQQDVEAVVNALWAGGASAMMVQDQRIVGTSAVRCVGNTLRLQGRVYSPPYVITAIGDVAALRRALSVSPEVTIYRQYVDAYGLTYRLNDKGTVTFPGFTGSLDLAHAIAGSAP